MSSRRLFGLAVNALLIPFLVAATAAAAIPVRTSVRPVSVAHADPTALGTITDVGPESQNGKLLQPVGVNSTQEIAFYGGAVWKSGAVTYAQAPASDPTATFTATAINDAGVVVGYSSTLVSNTWVYRPAYWNTSSSASFTELSVSGLTVNGQPASGGMFVAIDAAGDTVGNVWDSSGGIYGGASPSGYSNNAGLAIGGSGGVPDGSLSAVSSIGGSAIYSLDAISANFEEANESETRPELLIARATQTVTTTNVNQGEATPVSMASNGSMTGWVTNSGQSSSTLTLRLASGTESQLVWPSGYSGPVVSVNASNTAVGWVEPETSGPEEPVIWSSGGAATMLLNDLSDAGGWSDVYPVAINDEGYVAGYGTYNNVQSAFLIATKIKVPPVVNSTGDAAASDPSSGSCDTGSTVANAQGAQVPQCTLRAAIQTVNSLGNETPITFEIPTSSSSTPSITPGSALPAITAAGTVLDGTSESGDLVTIDGTGLGGKGDCLNVNAADVTVQGIDLNNCSTGVELQAPGNDKVQQDLIGVKADGSTPVRGGAGVEVDAGSTGNLIGGDDNTLGNVISDQSVGVAIVGSGNEVEGNLLGTDQDGSAFIPDQIGVSLSGSGNTIGGKTSSLGTAPGNVIVSGDAKSRFDYGIILIGSSNTVQGNTLGLNKAGDAVYAPKTGYAAAANILIAGGHAVIGGATGLGNLIAGAGQSQVLIDGEGAGLAHLAGNRIGAANDGDALESKDATGIAIAGANGSVIGADGAGNKITGQHYGIKISKDSQEIDYSVAETVDGVTTYVPYAIAGTDAPAKLTAATVKYNVIGPLPTGTRGPETPEDVGVLDDDGDEDQIGPRNVISWNTKGIDLDETNKIEISGNLIGTDSGGLVALPNAVGVYLKKTNETQIGAAGEPDTISGNALGIFVDGKKTTIQAELIGPSSRGNSELKPFSGKLPLSLEGSGYSHAGVDIDADDGMTIVGGDEKTEAVTVAGVSGTGILASGATALLRDRIGVGSNGTTALPNKDSGIDDTGGDPLVIALSEIAHNDGFGITEASHRTADIIGTTIYDNRKGGVVLHGADAPKAPKVVSAVNGGEGTDVKLDFTVPSGDTGLIQVFASPSCESHGAGKKLIGADGDFRGTHHNAPINAEVTEPVGTAITALLTVGAGGKLASELEDGLHLFDGNTSEFSECEKVAPSKK
jgi:CSLREA domain-containing protein